MDGILEELLRLEGAKKHALIALDSEAYETSVQKQTCLIDDPRLAVAARTGSTQLLAFSRLANINAELYDNLLATAPWITVASRSYTGDGHIANPPAVHGFSAEG
jgi:hypothetical protein